MAPRRKRYGYDGNETWSRQEFMNTINLNRTGKKRKKRVRRVPQMSRNKIMEAVMLGHMLGKNNKNAVQKNAILDIMSSSQMTGMGRV